VEIRLGEFHFAHVKTPNARNFVLLVNHGRRFPLGLGQDDVDEVLRRPLFD
jgi:hypothetical protein